VATLRVETMVNAPASRCFDLSRSIDLHIRTATASGETAIAGTLSGLLGLGDQVTWRGKHFGVWQTLTSRITAFDRPRHFRDSQVAGAFASLEHDHLFESAGSMTNMIDVFQYAAPLGPLGRVAEMLFLNSYLRRFLRERALIIKRVAESDEWKLYTPAA
jgi:ligand-binding SRPBCC domain-containing protein